MKKGYRLTKAGVAELQDELKTLVAKRGDVAQKLKLARDYGDLTENAEYHTARDEQVQVETRIKEIEHILRNVQPINQPRRNGHVQLGSTVVIGINGDQQTFTIVGSVEANPAENKISDESPIGQALLGKKIGESVAIKMPAGKSTYTVKSIH